MNSSSTLKHYKSGDYSYIYIYFKYKKGYIRINTKEKFIEGMHRKDMLYNSKMSGHVYLNQQIMNLKNKVDQYISNKLQYWRPEISQSECLEFIETGELPKSNDEIYRLPKTKTIFDYYDEFYEFKDTELQNKPSLKDYITLKNALTDYETYSKKKLDFDLLNDEDFFNRFRNFLYSKHADGYKTRGDLNSNTVHKRFSCLKTFMRYVQKKKYYRFEDYLYMYKIKKLPTDFVTLDREEIRELESLEISNPKWQRIIDVFVCNCFMSLRFSDLKTLEKGEFLQDDDGDYYYVKKNEKTGVGIEIPILPTALKILVKYDFELPKYTNQYFNRELKEILKHYNLFPQTVKKTVFKNGKPLSKEYLKRELISSHTCRRSYITNAISNNVSLNAIQSSTGHTQLSTLSKYVKRNQNKDQMKAID